MKRLLTAAVLLGSLTVPAAGQADAALLQRLDSIAGYWVQRDRRRSLSRVTPCRLSAGMWARDEAKT